MCEAQYTDQQCHYASNTVSTSSTIHSFWYATGMLSKRKKQIISITLILACILSVLFAARFFSLFWQYGPPPNQVQLSDPMLIKGWMSLQYISNAYQVPTDYLLKELNLKPGQERIPLRALEREHTTAQPEGITRSVQAAITAFYARDMIDAQKGNNELD